MCFSRPTRFALVLLAVSAAACRDERAPTTPPPVVPIPDAPKVVGVFEMTITGIGTDDVTSKIRQVSLGSDGGISPAMTAVTSGIGLEQVTTSQFNEGSRTGGGQRYLTSAFRVRNGTAGALSNLTFVMVATAAAIPGTPISQLRKFDGTNANPAIASAIVPTGATVLGADLVTMQSPYPDVLQVFTEAEVAAIAMPAGVINTFPYGYVVRNKNTSANRTLPSAAADANQFDGVLTAAFRIPLQAVATEDVFTLSFQFVAVTDTETRITETIEEAQDTAAVRRLRDRATALGATTTTVLNGSPAMDPGVADYPGQRQICSARTAGTAGAPTNTIVAPGAYSKVELLTATETVNSCSAYFRGGTASRPPTNVPFKVTVKAMDRYGNVLTGQADTVRLEETNGVPATMTPAAALASGTADIYVTYSNYGSSILRAQGRRLRGHRPIPVAGVLRYWTAGAGTTDWHTNGNWSPQAVPMAQDSVLIQLSAPLDPVLAANVTVRGVTVQDGATISLNAFDLTAHADVFTGTTGGITNTSGRLFLSGTAQTVQGVVPSLRVNGTYSLSGNVNARAPITIEAGRLTVAGLRLQASSQ
jgi:hypothetical protein